MIPRRRLGIRHMRQFATELLQPPRGGGGADAARGRPLSESQVRGGFQTLAHQPTRRTRGLRRSGSSESESSGPPGLGLSSRPSPSPHWRPRPEHTGGRARARVRAARQPPSQ